MSWSGTSPVQHRFGSASEHFLDRTRSMCSICSVVFVHFIQTTLHVSHTKKKVIDITASTG